MTVSAGLSLSRRLLLLSLSPPICSVREWLWSAKVGREWWWGWRECGREDAQLKGVFFGCRRADRERVSVAGARDREQPVKLTASSAKIFCRVSLTQTALTSLSRSVSVRRLVRVSYRWYE
ncbi:hypothetical protein CRG98_007383 [Punica granatum]|uniref:Secreted protein n=1 Tax=Punica granatum TaxID=22663 RepID=A0A2I0KUN8_PUNGR|nr:hypothetical protein CRG98_007383 [Punica granatum]